MSINFLIHLRVAPRGIKKLKMEKITEYTKNLNLNYDFIQEDGTSSSCGTGKCFMNKLRNSWVKSCEYFYKALELHGHDHYRAIGSALYSHIKSCEYTDEINKKTLEFFENQNKKLENKIEILVSNQIVLENQNKHFQNTEHLVQELNTENQEFKSLIYGMLDEINELKEHNKCLSERIHTLENKPPMILIN
jgi:hypothetical protein